MDEKIHAVFDYLSGNEIRWHDFKEVGKQEERYDWYYAENRLYLIRDRLIGTVFPVYSKSPIAALADYINIIFDNAVGDLVKE